MQSPALVSPNRETGLPPGVEVAPLGKRFVAYLIDISVPVLASMIIGFLLPSTSGGLRIGLSVLSAVVALVWALVLWIRLASRAATPGMQVMKLQLVGFFDGRPIGLTRALIRGVILWLLTFTAIGMTIMLIMLVLHPRKQGWHDLAAKAVMIKERTLPPAAPVAAVAAAAPQSGPQQGYAPPQSGPQQGYAPPQSYPQPQPAPQQYQPQYAPQQVSPQGYQPQPAPQPGPLAPPPGYRPPPSSPGAAQPPRLNPPPGAGTTIGPCRPIRSPLRRPARCRAPRPLTRLRSRLRWARRRPDPPAWTAVLDDGREISIDGLVLLGRNPQPQPGEEDAQLIKLADETRTVSKSHLAIGIDAGGLFVVDRGSTNGSTVTTPEGVSTRCSTGDIIYVTEDSIVSIGDHWFKIRRD